MPTIPVLNGAPVFGALPAVKEMAEGAAVAGPVKSVAEPDTGHPRVAEPVVHGLDAGAGLNLSRFGRLRLQPARVLIDQTHT